MFLFFGGGGFGVFLIFSGLLFFNIFVGGGFLGRGGRAGSD